MAKSGRNTLAFTPVDNATSSPDAINVNIGDVPTDNAALKTKYDEMHAEGPSAWFDDGQIERQLILNMGADLWQGAKVLEIGCGEGELMAMLADVGADVLGIDYSKQAINTAKQRFPHLLGRLESADYREKPGLKPDVIVMQGVLEHLDDPFGELAWMIGRFKPKTVITTSPGFLNPRGIVWMTLAAIGAVMSKTDLHYLHPWQFETACKESGWRLEAMVSADNAWGYSDKMANDFFKRIPLALRDGKLPQMQDLDGFIDYLLRCGQSLPASTINGAIVGYRISP